MVFKASNIAIKDEAEYLRFRLQSPLYPEENLDITVDGTTYFLNQEEAKEIVNQTDLAEAVVSSTFQNSDSISLEAAITMIGIDKLFDQLQIRVIFLTISPDNYLLTAPKDLAAIFEKTGISSANLFKLVRIYDILTNKGYNYSDFIGLVSSGIKEGVLDEIIMTIENQSGKEVTCVENTGPKHKIGAEDIYYGIRAVLVAAEFKRLINSISKYEYDELIKKFPFLKVGDAGINIANGDIDIAIFDKCVPEGSNAVTFGRNLIFLRRNMGEIDDNVPYSKNGTLLHELSHAYDRVGGYEKASVSESEVDAYVTRDLYMRIKFEPERYETYRQLLMQYSELDATLTKKLLSEIIPKALVDIIFPADRVTSMAVVGSNSAKSLFDIIQSGNGDLSEYLAEREDDLSNYNNAVTTSTIAKMIMDGNPIDYHAVANDAVKTISVPLISENMTFEIDIDDLEGLNLWYDQNVPWSLKISSLIDNLGTRKKLVKYPVIFKRFAYSLIAYIIILSKSPEENRERISQAIEHLYQIAPALSVFPYSLNP